MRALYLGGFPLSPSFNLYTHLFQSVFFPLAASSAHMCGSHTGNPSLPTWHSTTYDCGCPSLLPRSFLALPRRLAAHILCLDIFGGTFCSLEGISSSIFVSSFARSFLFSFSWFIIRLGVDYFFLIGFDSMSDSDSRLASGRPDSLSEFDRLSMFFNQRSTSDCSGRCVQLDEDYVSALNSSLP